MLVWIFQTGEPLHCDGENIRAMRAMNLADALVARGHQVTIWSSAFSHQKKEHRSKYYAVFRVSENLDIRLVPSWGYSNNSSLGRLLDHAHLAFNLAKYLSLELRCPDAAFVGYPPIEFAFVAIRWLRARRVPVLLDVKDQWPQIFVDRLSAKLQVLARIIFSPYFLIARKTIRAADAVVTISPSFMRWINIFSKRERCEFDCVATLSPVHPLVSVRETVDSRAWWSERSVASDGRVRFMFVGTMSKAFDFIPIYELAAKALQENLAWQFVLCGDGEQASEIRARFWHLPNVVILDWIDWPKMLVLSRLSTFGLAPYRPTADFNESIPNKVVDYFSFGLPVISALSGEVKQLIDSRGIGLNYDPSKTSKFFADVKKLLEDVYLIKDMSENALKLYKENFDGGVVYQSLCDKLELLTLSCSVSTNAEEIKSSDDEY